MNRISCKKFLSLLTAVSITCTAIPVNVLADDVNKINTNDTTVENAEIKTTEDGMNVEAIVVNGEVDLNEIFKDFEIEKSKLSPKLAQGEVNDKATSITFKFDDSTETKEGQSGFGGAIFAKKVPVKDAYSELMNVKMNKGDITGDIDVTVQSNGEYQIGVFDRATNVTVADVNVDLVDNTAPEEPMLEVIGKDGRKIRITAPIDLGDVKEVTSDGKTVRYEALAGLKSVNVKIFDVIDPEVVTGEKKGELILEQDMVINANGKGTIELEDNKVFKDFKKQGTKAIIEMVATDKADNASDVFTKIVISNRYESDPIFIKTDIVEKLLKHTADVRKINKEIQDRQKEGPLSNSAIDEINVRIRALRAEILVTLEQYMEQTGRGPKAQRSAMMQDIPTVVNGMTEIKRDMEFDVTNPKTVETNTAKALETAKAPIKPMSLIAKAFGPVIVSADSQQGQIDDLFNDLLGALKDLENTVDGLAEGNKKTLEKIQQQIDKIIKISDKPIGEYTWEEIEKELTELRNLISKFPAEDVSKIVYKELGKEDTDKVANDYPGFEDYLKEKHKDKQVGAVDGIIKDLEKLEKEIDKEIGKKPQDISKITDLVGKALDKQAEANELDKTVIPEDKFTGVNPDGVDTIVDRIKDKNKDLLKDIKEKELNLWDKLVELDKKGDALKDTELKAVEKEIKELPYRKPDNGEKTRKDLEQKAEEMRKDSKVEVKFQDKAGNDLIDPVVFDKNKTSGGKSPILGKDFTVEFPAISGYKPENKTGNTVTLEKRGESLVITFVEAEANINILAVETKTAKTLDKTSITGVINQAMFLEAKEIPTYVINDKKVVKYTPREMENEYKFNYKSIADFNLKDNEGLVEIRHINVETKEDLVMPTFIKSNIGDSMQIAPIPFKDWEYDARSNNSVTIAKGVNYITLKYKYNPNINPFGPDTDGDLSRYMKEYDYTIKNVDLSLTPIGEDVTGKALYGSIVTRRPKAIKGYTPIGGSTKVFIKEAGNLAYQIYRTSSEGDIPWIDGEKAPGDDIIKDLNEGENGEQVTYKVLFKSNSGEVIKTSIKQAPIGKTLTLTAPQQIDSYFLIGNATKEVTIDKEGLEFDFLYNQDLFGGNGSGNGNGTNIDGTINTDTNSNKDDYDKAKDLINSGKGKDVTIVEGDGVKVEGGEIIIKDGNIVAVDKDGKPVKGGTVTLPDGTEINIGRDGVLIFPKRPTGNGSTSSNSSGSKGTKKDDKVDGMYNQGGKTFIPMGHNRVAIRNEMDFGTLNMSLNMLDHVKYISGDDNGLARPNDPIKREETVTILYRILEPQYRKDMETSQNEFLDVDSGRWSNTEISTLAKMGIIKGKGEGKFVPTDNLTRAEAATMLVRFNETNVDTSNVALNDISGHWAEESIKKAATLGWINGYQDGSFKPNNKITRAEIVTIINKMLGRGTSADNMAGAMNKFEDIKGTDWFYLDFMEASTEHEFGMDNGVEKWTSHK